MSAACDFFEKCFYKKDRIYLKEMHKMKNMKKIAAGVLSLFMAVSSLGVNAFADDSDDYDVVFVQEDDIDEDDIFGSDSFFDDFGWYYDYDAIDFSEDARPTVSAKTMGRSIALKWDAVNGADYYKVYKYNSEKGKFQLLEKVYSNVYYDYDISSLTEYKYRVRAYKSTGEKTKTSKSCTVTTPLMTTTPDVYTKKKKIVLKWQPDEAADGYEVYYCKQEAPEEKVFFTVYSGSSTYSTAGELDYDAEFKKLKTTASSTLSIKRDSAYNYYFKIRTYKKQDGKKIYSDFSDAISSSSSMALFNGLSAKSRDTVEVGSYRSDIKPWTMNVTDSDKKILDKFIGENFTDDMSPYEKAEYAAQYIHNIVDYAYGDDYNRISGLSCVSAVFEKHSGQCYQYNGALAELLAYMGYNVKLMAGYRGYDSNDRWSHYWCEITIDGTKYVLDAGNKKDGLYNFGLPYECTSRYLTEE